MRHALALVLMLALSATAVNAQYVASEDYQEVDYTSPNFPAHVHERLTLFRPTGVDPADLPVVVEINNSGFRNTTIDTTEDITFGSPLGFYLDAGFAVVKASLTTSANNGEANFPSIHGNGLFHPPDSDFTAAHYDPYDSTGRSYHPMAEKDVVMIVQHLRYWGPQLVDLDPDRIALVGRSGGAVVSMWAAFGPERDEELFENPMGDPQPQDEVSTRPNAAILYGGPVFFPAYDQAAFKGHHLPAADSVWPWEDWAEHLQDAPAGYLEEVSPVVSEDYDFNEDEDLVVYMEYSEPYLNPNFLPTSGIPATDYDENFIPDDGEHLHTAWHGYVWKYRHPGKTNLVITAPGALCENALYDAYIVDHGLLALGRIDYLRDQLGIVGKIEHLTDSGSPSIPRGGTPTTPALTGRGDWSGGRRPVLAVSQARPLADAWILHGTTYDPREHRVFGEKVGPDGGLLMTQGTTDANGYLQFQVPSVYAGQESYHQVWIRDPDSGTDGWAGSNSVRVLP